MRSLNKALAGMMAAVMVLLGVSVTPAVADAKAPTTVYYDTDQEFAIADYWNADNPVAPVKDEFDFIIIDCPPSLGLITINILSGCDSVLIPLQCEFFALEGLSQLMGTIKKIKNSYNPELEIEGVILTMYDGRTNLTIQVAGEIKKYFKDKVFKSPVPRSVRLGEAPSYGEPILYYDKHSKCTAAYLDISEDILKNNKRRLKS